MIDNKKGVTIIFFSLIRGQNMWTLDQSSSSNNSICCFSIIKKYDSRVKLYRLTGSKLGRIEFWK